MKNIWKVAVIFCLLIVIGTFSYLSFSGGEAMISPKKLNMKNVEKQTITQATNISQQQTCTVAGQTSNIDGLPAKLCENGEWKICNTEKIGETNIDNSRVCYCFDGCRWSSACNDDARSYELGGKMCLNAKWVSCNGNNIESLSNDKKYICTLNKEGQFDWIGCSAKANTSLSFNEKYICKDSVWINVPACDLPKIMPNSLATYACDGQNWLKCGVDVELGTQLTSYLICRNDGTWGTGFAPADQSTSNSGQTFPTVTLTKDEAEKNCASLCSLGTGEWAGYFCSAMSTKEDARKKVGCYLSGISYPCENPDYYSNEFNPADCTAN